MIYIDMTSRSYCITFWQKPEPIDEKKIRYAIYGREICPNTGKEHWQSYVEFNSPLRMNAVKKIYNDNTCHIEKRNGTREEARVYCMKDKQYTEYGNWAAGGQGARTDLMNVKEKIDAGASLVQIVDEHYETYCKYHYGINKALELAAMKRNQNLREVEVTIITGPEGVGKSTKAWNENPGAWLIGGPELALGWYDGYNDQQTIIIDEYNNDVSVTTMLRLLDRLPLRLPIKGGHTYAGWKKVVITTNLQIDEIHAQAKKVHKNAFWRRVKHIVSMWDPEPGSPLEVTTSDDE